MQVTIYNTNKHRLVTVEVEFTDKNTTWFDDSTDIIYKITDMNGGLLIGKNDYSYPVWVDGVTREDIEHSGYEAKKLLAMYH